MSASRSGLIRCTRRIRDPLNYLIMQPTDADQVTTSIQTTDAAMITWFMPLHSLQYCLHSRYEAERFGELILPKGVPLPGAKPLTPTEADLRTAAAAAAGREQEKPSATRKEESSLLPKFLNFTPPKPSGTSSSVAAAAAVAQQELRKTPSPEGVNNYVNEAGDSVVPLGLVTLIIGNNHPAKQSWLETKIDPAPHPTLSLRVMVMDRIHWQRTSWLAGSICNSLCWGRLPQRIFSIQLDYENPIFISGGPETLHPQGRNEMCKKAGGDAAAVVETSSGTRLNGAGNGPLLFHPSQQRYVSPYQVDIPGLNFKLKIEDTGATLFDRRTRVVDGFLDNESALHRLALSREVNMLGLGGSVYRQTLWSSPSLPNVGRVVECEFGSLFERYFGCSPVGEPVATWLVDKVDKTLIYQMEGEVEDENDPNSATTYGDRSLTERVQKKAMNRYNDFRDDLRNKTYSEMKGEEVPR